MLQRVGTTTAAVLFMRDGTGAVPACFSTEDDGKEELASCPFCQATSVVLSESFANESHALFARIHGQMVADREGVGDVLDFDGKQWYGFVELDGEAKCIFEESEWVLQLATGSGRCRCASPRRVPVPHPRDPRRRHTRTARVY